MKARAQFGLVLVLLAASGCGLKGPLYLPEKSDVTIRPAPAATPPASPAATAPAQEPEAATEQEASAEPAVPPAPPPQDPPVGPDRG